MEWMNWYNGLTKPSWTPAPTTIRTIWLILYPVILVSFGFCFFRAFQGKVSWLVVLPFLINLVANAIFTPILFGMRNLTLASLDIIVVWGTIIWLVAAIWPHFRWVALAQVPYFLWVSIATALQLSIMVMNRAQ